MNEAEKSWEKFLRPETLRANLISISLFITAFEIFKDRVIEKPEILFTNGFDENGRMLDESYRVEVLGKGKSKLHASLIWLKEQGAIDQSDLDGFDLIRDHRNELAHESLKFIADHCYDLKVEKFQSLIQLLDKIERWWLINFELAINPEIFPSDIDPGKAISGPIWSLHLLLDIALGNEPEEGFYYKHFVQRERR